MKKFVILVVSMSVFWSLQVFDRSSIIPCVMNTCSPSKLGRSTATPTTEPYCTDMNADVTPNLFWPVDHAFDDKLAVFVFTVLCDLERFKRFGELERVGQQRFQVDQTSRDEVDRLRAEACVSIWKSETWLMRLTSHRFRIYRPNDVVSEFRNIVIRPSGRTHRHPPLRVISLVVNLNSGIWISGGPNPV